VLNTTLRDATAEELEDLFRKLKGLLWGDEPVEKHQHVLPGMQAEAAETFAPLLTSASA
jgi:hypothetical protein